MLRPFCPLLALFLLLPYTAHAGKITFDAAISEEGLWDSNPLMLTDGQKDLYGSTTGMSLRLKDETPTTGLNLGGRVNQSFFNQSSFDSTDFYGDLGLSHKVQRWVAALQSQVSYNTTRTSEITTFGEDIGSVRRLSYKAMPSLFFNPTETSKVGASFSYTRTTYGESTQTDYRTFSATPSYTYRFMPEHSIELSVRARRNEADNPAKTRTDSITPAVAWLFALTPRVDGTLKVGADGSRTKIKNTPAGDLEWRPAFEGEIRYKGEITSAELSLSRDQQSYSNGTSSLLTTVKAQGRQKLNEALSVNASGLYQRSDGGSTTGLESRIEASAGIGYLIVPEVELSPSYRYKQEKDRNDSKTAHANVGMIELVWRPTIKLED